MKKLKVLLSAFLLLALAPKVSAQVNIVQVFGSPFKDIGSLISTLLPNVIVLAGVILFGIILYGSFKLIIEAGKNQSPQAIQKAKDYLTFGVIGFLIVFSAYFILQIVSLMILGNGNLINSPVL
jgi:hypothetical protein